MPLAEAAAHPPLEVATLRRALAWGLHHFGTDARLPIGVDSLVTFGVADKGRSSSRALNSEWRRSIGLELACGVRDGLHYVPSRLNPADVPSRQQRLGPPTDSAPPGWASDAPPLAHIDR